MYKDYSWKFDEPVASEFDSHVRQSVPMYEEFHKQIQNICRYYIEDGTNVVDVGTSTGEFFSNMKLNRKCQYIGIDTEFYMIRKAQEKLQDKPVRLEIANILDYNISNCSVINMMLTLQFIKPKDKQRAIDNIYNALNKGGVLLLTDKVRSSHTEINDIYNDLYYDFKLENNLSYKDVILKNISLRGVQKTITLEENIDILTKAGFSKIDVFMKCNNFVGIIAIK